MKSFGEYIKSLRISKEITLRDFCKTSQQDPSNWSKIERGFLPPPKSKLVLEQITDSLSIQKNSEEYFTIFDLAAIAFIPKELLTDEELLEKLPILFRTNRGKAPTTSELEKLADKIKGK
jgi:transcriptional regulator with XRE-family HTH domain